jgi:hypothetical protein
MATRRANALLAATLADTSARYARKAADEARAPCPVLPRALRRCLARDEHAAAAGPVRW